MIGVVALRLTIGMAVVASLLWIEPATADPEGGAWLACAFVPIEETRRDVIPRCARRDADGLLVVEPIALRVLAARGVDPAAVQIGSTLHYLNAAGDTVPVLPFDNGADPFVEGLARTLQNGKVGFVDETLKVVIAPVWGFAFPFENGRALVCTGCTSRPVDGEHKEVVGGRWGFIDRRGEVVIPVAYSREALRRAQQRQVR